MTWAHYLLQVNIYLVIFYAFYKLLLDKETYFMLNRLYLVTAGLLSLAIPFIRPEWFVRQPATQQIKIGVDQLTIMMTQVIATPDSRNQMDWGELTAGIYIAGVLFFTARFIMRLLTVNKLINADSAGSAFSFLNKKVIDNTLPGLDTIHKHEEIHIKQLHTLDVIFFELLGVFNWCNPVIYLYKKTVKNIHEYLADEAAASFQGDKEAYAMLILSKAFGIDQNILTNNFFNKSLIKKRIFMLHKQRSKKTAILKYGLFLPLFAITLLLSSATISQNENIKAIAEEIRVPVMPGASTDQPDRTNWPENKQETPTAEQKYREDWTPFYDHLMQNLIYPAAARTQGIQGNSAVKFTITAGEVNGISVSTALGAGCDAEVMKSVLNFKDFKDIKDGKYWLRVTFLLNKGASTIKNTTIVAPKGYITLGSVAIMRDQSNAVPAKTVSADGVKVFDFVSIDKQPSFQGGMDMFYKYLQKTVRYPALAQKNNVQGKVFLSYIVETDGSLSNIKVERGVSEEIDAEAIRVMESSPKWIPGVYNGVPVRVKYNIPISFTLTSDENQDAKLLDNLRKILDQEEGVVPLYILDGKTIDAKLINTINANNIESVNVLKKAEATAVYGAPAKNGAIVITSKKAKPL